MKTTPYPSDQEAREMLVEFGVEVRKQGYVIATEGNLSVKVSPTELWITPADVSKGKLRPDILIKLDLDGNILEGNRLPSSENKMHLRVYRENPEVRGVVHCHPIYATSMAIAGIALDEPLLAEPMLFLGPVPVARYAKPGTTDVPDSIAPFCRDYNAVLLSNHGALTWGRDLQEAYYRMEVLETYAQLMCINRMLQQTRPLSNPQLEELYHLKVEKGLGLVKLPKGPDVSVNTTDVLPRMQEG